MRSRFTGKKTVVVRILVEREVWRRVKAKAALLDKTVAEYVGDILKKEVLGDEG